MLNGGHQKMMMHAYTAVFCFFSSFHWRRFLDDTLLLVGFWCQPWFRYMFSLYIGIYESVEIYLWPPHAYTFSSYHGHQLIHIWQELLYINGLHVAHKSQNLTRAHFWSMSMTWRHRVNESWNRQVIAICICYSRACLIWSICQFAIPNNMCPTKGIT